jgi:hypothetical protein
MTNTIKMLAGMILVCLAVAAYAAETIVVRYFAPEGGDAVIRLEADEGDDAADVMEIIMTAGGSGKIDIGGTTILTLSSSGITATPANLTQSDTNATTTVTTYTPAYKGQVLLGGNGTGTNGVWIAKGTTTNDWVQVAP